MDAYMNGKRDAYFINGDAYCTEEELRQAEEDRAILVDVFGIPYKDARLMSANEAHARLAEMEDDMESQMNKDDFHQQMEQAVREVENSVPGWRAQKQAAVQRAKASAENDRTGEHDEASQVTSTTYTDDQMSQQTEQEDSIDVSDQDQSLGE